MVARRGEPFSDKELGVRPPSFPLPYQQLETVLMTSVTQSELGSGAARGYGRTAQARSTGAAGLDRH